jgi:hypothetical protein
MSALPNSENTAPLFVAPRPDWNAGQQLTANHATAITTARTGQEQRTRGRRYPQYRLQYERTGLSLAQHNAAQAEAREQAQKPLWVPFWPLLARLANNPPNFNTVTIDLDPWEDWWTPGQWVYVWKANDYGQWRQIASVAGRVLTLETAEEIGFSAGDYIAPARFSRRLINDDTRNRRSLASYTETLTFESLA